MSSIDYLRVMQLDVIILLCFKFNVGLDKEIHD